MSVQELRLDTPHGRRYVGRLCREGLALYHHGSRQHCPLSWPELVARGAEVFGCSPSEFLSRLREISLSTDEPVGPSPSGPGALLEPENVHRDPAA